MPPSKSTPRVPRGRTPKAEPTPAEEAVTEPTPAEEVTEPTPEEVRDQSLPPLPVQESVVTVEVRDANPNAARDLETEAQELAADSRRADRVAALQNERAALERQPVRNERRISEVEDEIDLYSEKPAKRHIETRG